MFVCVRVWFFRFPHSRGGVTGGTAPALSSSPMRTESNRMQFSGPHPVAPSRPAGAAIGVMPRVMTMRSAAAEPVCVGGSCLLRSTKIYHRRDPADAPVRKHNRAVEALLRRARATGLAMAMRARKEVE